MRCFNPNPEPRDAAAAAFGNAPIRAETRNGLGTRKKIYILYITDIRPFPPFSKRFKSRVSFTKIMQGRRRGTALRHFRSFNLGKQGGQRRPAGIFAPRCDSATPTLSPYLRAALRQRSSVVLPPLPERRSPKHPNPRANYGVLSPRTRAEHEKKYTYTLKIATTFFFFFFLPGVIFVKRHLGCRSARNPRGALTPPAAPVPEPHGGPHRCRAPMAPRGYGSAPTPALTPRPSVTSSKRATLRARRASF